MPQVTETEVFRACRTLFGPELNLSQEFLAYLQPAGARSAYRKKAKVIHPDRFAVSATAVQAKHHRLFQDLNQAHQTVQDYLKQRTARDSRSSSNRYSTVRPQPSRTRQEQPSWSQQNIPLPTRPLQFGMFLYHLKIIPFDALISAIIWQRRQRPNLGDIAKRWGWLDDAGVRTVLHTRSGLSKFGEKAIQLELLTQRQVNTLLFYQRSLQKPLGFFFVEQGYFDETTMQQLVQRQAEHNRTYGQGFANQYYYWHRK